MDRAIAGTNLLRKSNHRLTVVSSLSLFLLLILITAHSILAETTGTERGKSQLLATYGRLPLSFEANHGQTDAQVKFLSRGRGYSLFLTPSEAVLVLRKAEGKGQQASEKTDSALSTSLIGYC